MALNRRFFTNLAADYKEARPHAPLHSTEFAVWMHMVTITAGNLAAQNAMFNFARFYEAAGMPQHVVEAAAEGR